MPNIFSLKSGCRSICILVFTFLSSASLFAQEPKHTHTNVAFLKQNGVELAKSMKKEKQRAFDMAKKKGWPTYQITRQGKIIQLTGIDDAGLPIYDATENEIAAATTRANKLYAGGGLGLSLSGSTIPNSRVAVWDGGSVLASHQEFGGRVIVMDGATASAHGTHVAGTIAAAGVYSSAKGMAFGLPHLLSYDFNNDNAEMSANAATLLLSNHSYGVVAGWTQNSDQSNRWEFRGRWGEDEDYKFGYYDTKARDWDNICFNAPYYLPVKSAGNYRNDNGPAVGATYYRYNASGTMINAGARPANLSSNDGYGIVANYGTAKNILTVGAVNGLKYGSTSPSDIVFSAFTAWGPTDDGRIKPDLVADGVNMTSTNSTGNANYYTSSGTSMAAPNATGTLVLLQELYNQQNSSFMKSATLKGLAIATTSEAGTHPGPDYQYGWGLLNAEKAAKAILDNNTKSLISERVLAQGETQNIQVVASGNGPLVATICWTERAATPISSSSAAALNNPSLRLLNDLDTRITDGSTTFFPWVLDPANPAFAATTGDNFRDNVEQVYIANAVPGKTYTISITHKNSLQDGNQAFSLIVTGVGGTPYCVSAPTSNSDSKITNFQLSNVNYTAAAGCTAYTDLTGQTVLLEKGKTYSLSLLAGTCNAGQSKIAKVFVDWNGDGDFDDAGELVATSPVIVGNGSFSQSISVPAAVVVDNFSLLRVVLSETSTAGSVSACGTYAKGETQDYRVKFTEAAINVGIAEIVDPNTNDIAGNNRNISLKLKNYGANSVLGIPITVIVKDGATTVATITETYNGAIPSGGEVTFLVQGSFNAAINNTYTITAKTDLALDAVSTDDQAIKLVTFNAPQTATDIAAYTTDVAGTYYLTASQNNGTAFWYNAAATATPFANGNDLVSTSAPLANNTYYASFNNYLGSFGPATKAAYGASGNYGQAPFRLYYDATAPLVIESARLYVGYSGAVTFNVFDANSGVKVASSHISVTHTRSPADPSTSAANVAGDLGQVYNLGLRFPYAGAFYITAEFNNGATLFRNNNSNGTFTYPIAESNGLLTQVSHTGSSASMNSFYYFFYDIKAKSIGETSATKTAVPLTALTITPQGNLLASPIANGNQWYLNGNMINGASSSTYQPIQTGNYTVKVTVQGGITITSNVYQLNVLPIVLRNFTAKKQVDGVLLKWSTLSEINNKEFIVEHATNVDDFRKIATVAANTNKIYSYLHKLPAAGINYYRITQTDYNSKTETFEPISIKYDVNSDELSVYENPVRSNFTVKANNLDAQTRYTIRITNIIGLVQPAFKLSGAELMSGYQINATNLTAGTYVLEVKEEKTGTKKGLIKFVKL